MSEAQNDAIAKILEEREYQDLRWGNLSEHPHEVGGWLTILRHHLHTAEQAWATGAGFDADCAAMHEIRKIAATCLASMEQHGAPGRSKAQIYVAKCAREDQAKS